MRDEAAVRVLALAAIVAGGGAAGCFTIIDRPPSTDDGGRDSGGAGGSTGVAGRGGAGGAAGRGGVGGMAGAAGAGGAGGAAGRGGVGGVGGMAGAAGAGGAGGAAGRGGVSGVGGTAGAAGTGGAVTGTGGNAGQGVLVSVTKTGAGTGTVKSSVPGIDCGSMCAASFTSTSIVLTAQTANGSGSFFLGWGGDCAGLSRTCTLTLGREVTVTARFEPIDHNLVFASSRQTIPTNLGGAAAYDGLCNQFATTAGINNAGGDAYVSWLSDSRSSVLTRLGTARGFMRMDGLPFADDPMSLVAESRLFYPINFDETGALVSGTAPVLTGMNPETGIGDPTASCSDWTTASPSLNVTAGSASSGPYMWFAWELIPCDWKGAVYCFMRTQTTMLTPPKPVAGRKIFLTNTAVAVGDPGDAQCETDKPAGTGPVRALRSSTTVTAGSLLTPGIDYVRPDGVIVGQASDFLGGTLRSGIWQQGNGAYLPGGWVWTGSSTAGDLGTLASTCSDGISTAGMGAVGSPVVPYSWGWWWNGTQSCAYLAWLYCIER